MRVHDDIRLLRLPEDLGQANGGHTVRGDHVPQEIARPYRRQLVGVADEHEPRPVGQCLDQRLHEHDVYHRDLVQNDRIAFKRVGQVARKGCAPARYKTGFKQAVDGFCLHAGQVGQPLSRTPCRCGKQGLQPERLEHLQDAAHCRCFAGARPAGQDDQPVACRARDRMLLLVRIGELRVLHKRAQQLVHIKVIFIIALSHVPEHFGQIGLRVVHAAQIDRIPSGDILAYQLSGGRQAFDAGQGTVLVKHYVIVRKQGAHRMNKLFYRNKSMAIVQIKGQRIGHARICALVRQQGQPQLHREPVRKLEIHIIIRVAQQIWVFAQCIDRAVMQALVQQRRECDRQTMFI